MNGLTIGQFRDVVNFVVDILKSFYNQVLKPMPGLWFAVWIALNFVFPWLKKLVRALRGV